MSVGGVSKTAFHQMLPAFPIESGSLAVGFVDALDPRGFDRDGV
jgi:hypothetical protein